MFLDEKSLSSAGIFAKDVLLVGSRKLRRAWKKRLK